jgi:hypothetical protein
VAEVRGGTGGTRWRPPRRAMDYWGAVAAAPEVDARVVGCGGGADELLQL